MAIVSLTARLTAAAGGENRCARRERHELQLRAERRDEGQPNDEQQTHALLIPAEPLPVMRHQDGMHVAYLHKRDQEMLLSMIRHRAHSTIWQ